PGDTLSPPQRQGVDPLERACLEMLAAAHEQRRPAKLVSREQCLDTERVTRRVDLKRDQTRYDEVELRAIVAFAEEDLDATEAQTVAHRRKALRMAGFELEHERMMAQRSKMR